MAGNPNDPSSPAFFRRWGAYPPGWALQGRTSTLPWLDLTGPDFRAKGDGQADDSGPMLAALKAAYNNGGGTIVVASGAKILCFADLAIPNDGQNSLPRQPPIRICGEMGTSYGYWTGPGAPAAASILDLRYAGGGASVAKIDSRGAGLLEIDHLALLSGGADNYPFLQTTNTTVKIHDNYIAGNSANGGQTSAQDAFIMGGTGATVQDLGSNSMFQGYGSKIKDNFYDRIRRCVTFGAQSNGIEVENETVSKTCGSAGAIDAPFFFSGSGAGGGSAGGRIRGGTVELTNYKYLVVCDHTTGWLFDSIGEFDDGAYTAGLCYVDANSGQLVALYQWGGVTGFFSGPGAADCTQITGRHFDRTNFVRGLIVGNLDGKGLDASLIRTGPAGTIQAANDANPAGGNMKIDTGTGGSHFDLNAIDARFNDNNGALQAAILMSSKGAMRSGTGTTANRPSAVTAGAGARWYDTTLSKPIFSDGAVWRDAAGTAV